MALVSKMCPNIRKVNMLHRATALKIGKSRSKKCLYELHFFGRWEVRGIKNLNVFLQIMFQLNSELVPNVLEIFIPFKNLNELHHWYVPFTYFYRIYSSNYK